METFPANFSLAIPSTLRPNEDLFCLHVKRRKQARKRREREERSRTAERGGETEREGLNVGEKESVARRSNFEQLPSSNHCRMFRVGEKNAEPHVVITALLRHNGMSTIRCGTTREVCSFYPCPTTLAGQRMVNLLREDSG